MIRENVDRQPVPAGPRLGLRQQRHLGRPGCRAQFSYGRDDGGGGGNWNRPGELTCESIGYRYRYCNADTDGRVSLVRELSTGNLCQQGRGWGYDNNGIWVDRGCRGVFRVRPRQRRRATTTRRSRQASSARSRWAPRSVRRRTRNRRRHRLLHRNRNRRSCVPPSWAIGSFQAYDPDSGDIVQLVVDGGGRVYLRNENGAVVSQGDLRDGMIYWSNGKRSWLAREGPGVLVGDVDTGKHFYFRRNA